MQEILKSVFGKSFLAVGLVAATFGAFAATEKVWTGGASGNWYTPDNWNPSGVPTADSTVTFNSSATVKLDQNGDADLNALSDGKVEIDGEYVFAYASTVDLVPVCEDGGYEDHRRYIDIHVPLAGEELIGIRTLMEREIAFPFNAKDDYVVKVRV